MKFIVAFSILASLALATPIQLDSKRDSITYVESQSRPGGGGVYDPLKGSQPPAGSSPAWLEFRRGTKDGGDACSGKKINDKDGAFNLRDSGKEHCFIGDTVTKTTGLKVMDGVPGGQCFVVTKADDAAKCSGEIISATKMFNKQCITPPEERVGTMWDFRTLAPGQRCYEITPDFWPGGRSEIHFHNSAKCEDEAPMRTPKDRFGKCDGTLGKTSMSIAPNLVDEYCIRAYDDTADKSPDGSGCSGCIVGSYAVNKGQGAGCMRLDPKLRYSVFKGKCPAPVSGGCSKEDPASLARAFGQV